jgi:hypothetical protein
MLSHSHVREFHERTYRTQTNDDCTNRLKRTLNYFIDYRFRSEVIDSLMAEFFADEQRLAREYYLTEDEISEMHAGGMIFGSHTVNHPCLSKLGVAQQKAEIDESFAFLESIIGSHPPKTFCYPYGGFHSFTGETERLLAEAGCCFSFNVEPRDITTADLTNRPQALPRYDCNAFPYGCCRAGRPG